MKFTENGIELQESDDNITLEGITNLEKILLSTIRTFREKDYILDLIADISEETICSLVHKSVEDKAMRILTTELQTGETQSEDAYDRWVHLCNSLESEDEFINSLIGGWRDNVEKAITGDLPSLSKLLDKTKNM